MHKIKLTKILTIISCIIFPLLAISVLNIGDKVDPFAIFAFLAIGMFGFIEVLKKSTKNVLIPYIAMQFMLFIIAINLAFFGPLGLNVKLHTLVFIFGFLIASYALLKDFKYLWKNYMIFRALFIFFIINIIYISCSYYSEFLSSSTIDLFIFRKTGNLTTRNFNPIEYKFLIYMTSLVPLVTTTMSLLVFKDCKTKEEIFKKFIYVLWIFLLIFAIFNVFALLSAVAGISAPSFSGIRLFWKFWPGTQMPTFFLGLFTIFFIFCQNFFKNFQVQSNQSAFNIVLNVFILINSLLIVLISVKTALISLVLSLIILIVLLKKNNFTFTVFNLFTKKPINMFGLSLILLFVVVLVQYSELIWSNLILRFSNLDTLYLRFGMWANLTEVWRDNLDLFKLIFGFGIDRSKEQAFLASNMLPRADIVPNVHNSFLEMFYEYGLVAFIYFGAIFHILFNDIKAIINQNTDKMLKMISIATFVVIAYFLTYHITDGIKVATAFTFFSLLGFLESLKFSLKKSILKESC